MSVAQGMLCVTCVPKNKGGGSQSSGAKRRKHRKTSKPGVERVWRVQKEEGKKKKGNAGVPPTLPF